MVRKGDFFVFLLIYFFVFFIELDYSQSLEAQNFHAGQRILFYELNKPVDITSMKIFHDIQEKQHNRGTKQKTDLDFDDILPGDLDLEVIKKKHKTTL